MAKVDFYILSNEGPDEPLKVACRIADKAWRQGNRVRVQVGTADVLRRLDDMMWTFKQESFLPHEIDGQNAGDEDLDPAPVLLDAGAGSAVTPDVLINLTGELPDGADRVSRIAEIVPTDPDAVASGRERYRHYRERGFELDTHKV